MTETGDLVCFEATPKAYRERARARLPGKPTRAEVALANGLFHARDDDKLICVKLRKE